MTASTDLSGMYRVNKDGISMNKVSQEMELLEDDSRHAQDRSREYLESRIDGTSSITTIKASFKVGLWQKEEIRARQMADRMQAEVQVHEEQFTKEKVQLESKFHERMKIMEIQMQQEHTCSSLKDAEEELQTW